MSKKLGDKAREIQTMLSKHFMVDYDDAVYSTVLSADTVSALVRSSRFESRTPVPEDLSSAHLVTLSTCSYEFEDARFVGGGCPDPHRSGGSPRRKRRIMSPAVERKPYRSFLSHCSQEVYTPRPGGN